MKGIVLAGGFGTRLSPLTDITNKHLLPVYDKPMIYYPIEKLVSSGIEDIMIVTGGERSGDFLRLLGNGEEFGLKHLNYTHQKGAGGIAEALGLCEYFVDEDDCTVILGDNIFEDDLKSDIEEFERGDGGARVLLKEVDNPSEYGVVRIEDGEIVEIIEKPEKPPSNLAVTGIYIYDPTVFDIVKTLKPSDRGELEITDVNMAYLKEGKLQYRIMEGFWGDAGENIDALYDVSKVVRELGL